MTVEAPQLLHSVPHNTAALLQLNKSLAIRQQDPAFGTPRKESMIKTGYSVYKKGQLI